MQNSLFRKKNISHAKSEEHRSLRKVLGPIDLLAMGIGTIMGTGIFVLTGIQAAKFSGPAVTISLALAAFVAIFIALVYTEVASSLPSSGGSYAYTYAAFGELPACLIGWAYLMQCACAVPAIAAGWGGYFTGILSQLGIHIPEAFSKTPYDGGIINLPAVFICLLMTCILIRGIKESATLNMVLVFIKLLAAFLFIGIAFPSFKLENWSSFMPYNFSGVVTSAGVLFFAYNGFDSVANAAEECKNPTKDITIGLIGSLVVCGTIYVAIGAMLTGIVPYTQLNTPEALSFALRANGSNIGGALVAAGGLAGITTVVLFQLYSQTRILMAMSRDRFLPSAFGRLHKKLQTPHIGTIVCGSIAAIVAGFYPISILGNISSFLILTILMIVVAATIWLRMTRPALHRPFKCPALHVVGAIAMFSCLYLLYGLFASVGHISLILISSGFILYFLYSKPKLDKHFAPKR